MSDDTIDQLLRCPSAEERLKLLGQIIERHKERLRYMVDLRLDPRIRRRIDASDVIQEASLEASRRLDEFLRRPKVPLFIWLRFLVGQSLQAAHRHHLGTGARDVRREVSLCGGPMPEASSADLAARLLGTFTSPSQAAIRTERKIRVQEALNSMEPMDREILALRHFEHLTSAEAAQVLGIEERAASKRYVRALERLRKVLTGAAGGKESSWI